MAPNHSEFAATGEDHFLAGTRVLSTLEKLGSFYLKKDFQWDCKKFLADFVSFLLSTFAARSVTGQELSCLCPLILVSGNDHGPMQLFDMFFVGIQEKSWVRGAEMEA